MQICKIDYLQIQKEIRFQLIFMLILFTFDLYQKFQN